MPQSLDESVFRILGPNGETIGTGSLVSRELVVTSAHVVLAAKCEPGGKISVRFYKGKENLETEVLVDPWSPVEAKNLAFLRLPSLPSNARPLKLASVKDSATHPYITLGFTKRRITDVRRPTGIINGLVPIENGHELLEITGSEIGPGMSGAPILDLSIDRVVALVQMGYDDKYSRVVYATPADEIRECFPSLVFTIPDFLADKSKPISRPSIIEQRTQLLETMKFYLSSDDMRELCFVLGVSWDSFSHRSKTSDIIEMIEYFEVRSTVPELVKAIRNFRPNANLSLFP